MLLLDTYTHMTFISSCYIDLFIIKCPSLPVVIILVLKSVLFYINITILASFNYTGAINMYTQLLIGKLVTPYNAFST